MTYKVVKKNVLKAIAAGKRLDLRELFEQRDIQIRFGVSNKAEGSVSVKMGKTEVVCGIKMGVAEPYTDHEAEGTMMTSLELTPMSSPSFEYGPPSIESVETARIIDRGIRESGFIDFKKLCIKEGEKVWSIFIDLATINDDGNLIDAGAFAALLALRVARFPVYDEKKEKIEFGEFTDKKLPLNVDKMPVTLTFFKIGESLFLDPTREEEEACDGRLTMEISKPAKEEIINAMQKGGEACLTIEDVERMLEEATKIYKKLGSLIETEVEKEEKTEKHSKKK
jgi:exosome complex component RRP42